MAKTWKREVAFLILVYLGWLGYVDKLEILKIMIWPGMLFVGAAFSMAWAGGQGEKILTAKYTVSADGVQQSSGESVGFQRPSV
ncbi:MAG: hypothetical protein COA78_20235 [Blastopirellula sp.]|nr:MAG: hypothetical protein COA78_20235 [Blastopirellula sp.]